MQASRHQAHKNGTIFKVRSRKNDCFFHGDGNDDVDDHTWVEAYQLKSFWSDLGNSKRRLLREQTNRRPWTNASHTFDD